MRVEQPQGRNVYYYDYRRVVAAAAAAGLKSFSDS